MDESLDLKTGHGELMKILDHEPHFWYLADSEGHLFLDANCNHSFIGYSWMIQLSPEEASLFKSRGRDYLSELAQEIQDSAPIVAGTTSRFKGRDVTKTMNDKLLAAIEAWDKGKSK